MKTKMSDKEFAASMQDAVEEFIKKKGVYRAPAKGELKRERAANARNAALEAFIARHKEKENAKEFN